MRPEFEDFSANAGEQNYKSWFQDPKQVERLVLMLEERAVNQKTEEEGWKYSSGHAFRAMFPTDRMPYAVKYERAQTPASLDSFKVTLKHLEAGRNSFGMDVSMSLIQRFRYVMAERAGSHAIEQETYWDRPHKLLAAGLIEYCGLTSGETQAIFKEKLGYAAGAKSTISSDMKYWKKKKEFPYEKRNILVTNDPLAIAFVDYLSKIAGMTLQDVHALVKSNHDEMSVRVKHIEHFIESYGNYRKKWQVGLNSEAVK